MLDVRINRSGTASAPLGPLGALRSAWQNRVLIARLARREIESRYRGSVLGLAWSAIVPLLMLTVYTFVFSVIFKARWDVPVTGRGEFAMLLFSGLILFSFFAECINRAPGVMLENVSYIKKLIFPLEIMAWVIILVALFNAAVSASVLVFFYIILRGLPPLSVLLLPLLAAPLILVTHGLTCFLASIGVFVRDIRQFIGVFTTLLMFLSPVFYPLSAVPEGLRGWLYLNPLTLLLEGSKQLLFWGAVPDSSQTLLFALYALAAWLCSWAGYVWFMKTKKGFADVV